MFDDVSTDLILPGEAGPVGQGSVAQKLLSSGFKVNALRTNDTLQYREWIQFDSAVIQVARARLVIVNDLIAAGLTYDLANGLGTMQIDWQQEGDFDDAEMTMSGVARSQRDRPDYTTKSMPVPVTHKEFELNARALAASRRLGESLDTTSARLASRKVSEKIERTFFDGSTIKVGSNGIEGLTNATNRNTGSLTGNWALAATTPASIITDILAMMAALKADNMYGPYALYIPIDYDNRFNDDYNATSGVTIRQRVLSIPDIRFVRATSYLSGGASGEVLLIQLSTDVVDVVRGLDPTMVQWDSQGGLEMNFKVLSIIVPRVKYDALGQSGIAHFSV